MGQQSQSRRIWSGVIALGCSLSYEVVLRRRCDGGEAMCRIAAMFVCIFSLPAATSAWRLGPKSASFQLIGHNLPLHFQFPGEPLKLELLHRNTDKGAKVRSYQRKL